MAIRKANRPAIDKDGMSSGLLDYVQAGTGVRKEKKGRDVEEIEFARYEFYFKADGVTGEPVTIKVYTGTVINDEPVEVLAKGRGKKAETRIYNRLTTLCLRLGLLNEEQLTTVTDEQLQSIDNALMGMEKIPVSFKVAKNAEGFYAIDLNSIARREEG